MPKINSFFCSIQTGIQTKLLLTNVNWKAFFNVNALRHFGIYFEGGFFSEILPWHVANKLYSLTTYISINRSPSPVLGHHPFLVYH